MRIAVTHVVISLDPGGLERLVVDMANARNQQMPGSTSTCCLDHEGVLASEVLDDAVFCANAKRSRFPWDMRAVQQLRGMATREGTIILHAHNTAAWQYAVLAAKGTGAKVVVTHHGSNLYTGGLLNGLRNHWLTMRTDASVAVSESVRAELIRLPGFAGHEMAVVQNGVRSQESGVRSQGADFRQELGIAEDTKVVGYVGRLSKEKGVDRLIDAFAAIVQSSAAKPTDQELFLILIGDGDQRSDLEQQAKQLGVSERVVFAGYRSDARDLLSVMDLFVLPSRSEGLPVALLEAMLARVPVAATDCGESRAILGDGEFGAILPDDESKWPQMLEAQLSAKHDEVQLAAAMERVEKNYSFDAMLGAYERLYSELLAGSEVPL